jgi:hypothetical protein
MKKNTISVFVLIFLISTNANAQMIFNKVFGKKASYSIEVPKQYYLKEAIGANVDIKYIDSYGASVITVVKKLPSDIRESDIYHMNDQSDYEFIDEMEAMGMQNISLIKRGLIYFNGVKSYYAYYRDLDLYYHSITQFKKGKNFNLTYTCAYQQKDSYMPYIFRVVNSINWK